MELLIRGLEVLEALTAERLLCLLGRRPPPGGEHAPIFIQAVSDFCERVAGLLPHTFACLAIPIVVQAALLLLWGLRWRPPSEEAAEE